MSNRDQPGFQNLFERSLFARTFSHPVVGHHVEWVPTRWLAAIANPRPHASTDLGGLGSDERVSLDEVFEHMLRHGMRDPFIVGVGRVTRTIRLETGNQRIVCMTERGIERVPAVAYVGDTAVTSIANGTHLGMVADLLLPAQQDTMWPYPIREYMALSSVIADLPWARRGNGGGCGCAG